MTGQTSHVDDSFEKAAAESGGYNPMVASLPIHRNKIKCNNGSVSSRKRIAQGGAKKTDGGSDGLESERKKNKNSECWSTPKPFRCATRLIDCPPSLINDNTGRDKKALDNPQSNEDCSPTTSHWEEKNEVGGMSFQAL